MLELLIATTAILTIGIVQSCFSGNLLQRLVTAKVICTGIVLLAITTTASIAPEMLNFLIQILTVTLSVLLCFASLLILRYYFSRNTVETDEMTF